MQTQIENTSVSNSEVSANRRPPMQITYKLAMAAGRDAANKQMRDAGRSAWSEDDYNLACEAVSKLLGA